MDIRAFQALPPKFATMFCFIRDIMLYGLWIMSYGLWVIGQGSGVIGAGAGFD